MADPQMCGYGCGKPWVPWAGSRLIGHARCLYSPEEAEALLVRFEADPRLREAQLATELGVTVSVVRATLGAARRRRIEAARSGAAGGAAHAS